MRWLPIRKILFGKWIWQMINLPAQIHQQQKYNQYNYRRAIKITADNPYNLFHGRTLLKVKPLLNFGFSKI